MKLPKPDEFGNYYLKLRACPPCILEINNLKHPCNIEREGNIISYMVILEPKNKDDCSVVFDEDGYIKAFSTPEEALKYINNSYDKINIKNYKS